VYGAPEYERVFEVGGEHVGAGGRTGVAFNRFGWGVVGWRLSEGGGGQGGDAGDRDEHQ